MYLGRTGHWSGANIFTSKQKDKRFREQIQNAMNNNSSKYEDVHHFNSSSPYLQTNQICKKCKYSFNR